LACGNTNVSRSYLSSQPQPAAAPLTAIRVTLPENKSSRGDVYVSTMGTFVDQSDPNRGEPRITDVRTLAENPKTGKHEQQWDHKLDAEHRDSKLEKPYSHLSAKIAEHPGKRLIEKLPAKDRLKLEKQRTIIIAKQGSWKDERGVEHKTIYHGPK
jgi:hypothetical protein